MTTITNIALSVSVGLLALSNGFAAQAGSSHTLTMKPLAGISFDIGAKRAVSYFSSQNNQCKLVLTMADESSDAHFTVTRFEASVGAGKATRYTSSEGKVVDFACAADAQAMTVNPVSQFAATGE
jgi:hypothetical protein